MVETVIIREWVAKADEDFEFALVNLKEGKPFSALICFHFHQSAEKYLKAYIVAHDLGFIKSHDLPALLKICVTKEPSLIRLSPDCEFLNTFYIETRYPVHWPTHFTVEEAKRLISPHRLLNSLLRKASTLLDCLFLAPLVFRSTFSICPALGFLLSALNDHP